MDCEYRWSVDYAIHRVFTSFLGWFFIIGFPGGGFYIASMNKPHEGAVGVGVVVLIFAATVLHSRKYWRRFSDRSVQVALRAGGIWAKQWNGESVAWEDILAYSGLEERVSLDVSVIVLRTNRGDVRLDLTGLDTPMITIFKEIEARCGG